MKNFLENLNPDNLKNKSFGEILRQERKKQGLNTVDFGKLLGCTGSYISQVETGVKLPSKGLVNFLLTISEIPKELIVQKIVQAKLELKKISWEKNWKKKMCALENELLNVKERINNLGI